MTNRFNRLILFWLLCFSSSLLSLCGCASTYSEPSVTETKQLSDGTQITYETKNGMPLPVENEWAEVKTGGLVIDKMEHSPRLIWRFALVFRTNGVNSVTISDVTTIPAKTWIQSTSAESFKPKSKTWIYSSDEIPPDSQEMKWLSEQTTTEKIFRVVLRNFAGEEKSLYQPVIYEGHTKQGVLGMLNVYQNPRAIFIQ